MAGDTETKIGCLLVVSVGCACHCQESHKVARQNSKALLLKGQLACPLGCSC